MSDQENLNDRLKQAATFGYARAVAQALEDGADAMARDSCALRAAASAGHVECVGLLIPRSDPKAQDSLALRWAAACGQAPCVKLLIAVSDPTAMDSEALRIAALRGHGECVGLLLPASDPLAVGDDGLDAAGRARAEGHVEVAGMIEAFMEATALSEAAQNAKIAPRAKSTL
jgi:ankyrin repeat protein